MRLTSWLGLAMVLLLSAAAPAEWKPPADKVVTEERYQSYIATLKDLAQENHNIASEISNAATDAQKMQIANGVEARMNAIYQRHNMNKAEVDWIGGQLIQAWGVHLLLDQAMPEQQAKLDEMKKSNEAGLAESQQRLATYQAALKTGVRVLSTDERAHAIDNAKSDEQSATDEAKQHAEEARADESEAAQYDKQAREAAALADHPPADVAAEDRPTYVEGKRKEEADARAGAGDARTREAEALKLQNQAMARAAADAKVEAHPELPGTDEDKAAVKADTEAGIAQAQADIAQRTQQAEQLSAAMTTLKEQTEQSRSSIPTQDLDLLRKHADEYSALLKSLLGGDAAATQPS